MGLAKDWLFWGASRAQAAMSSSKQVEAKSAQATAPTAQGFGSQFDRVLEEALGISLDGRKSGLTLYRKSSALHTVVEKVATAVERIKPAIRMRNGDIVRDSEVLAFLKAPNDHQGYQQFIGDLARHILLDGNGFVLANGNPDRPPLEIYPGFPGMFHIERHEVETGEIFCPQAYQSSRFGRFSREPVPGRRAGVRFVDQSGMWQLVHIMGFSSRACAARGDSPIDAIEIELRQLLAGAAHNVEMLANGARLSMLFSVKEDLPQDVFNDVESAIRRRFGGSKNAGSVGVVAASEIDVKEFGTNNKDMDFVNLMATAREVVACHYGVPLPLIAKGSQTFSNYNTAVDTFYDDAVEPVVSKIFQALTRSLMPRFGIDAREQELAIDPESVETLRRRMLDEAKLRASIRAETIDEIREALPNRHPMPSGMGGGLIGDPLSIPMSEDAIADEKLPGHLRGNAAPLRAIK